MEKADPMIHVPNDMEPPVLDILGTRQKELLRALLGTSEGLSAEALGRHLGITTNAVRQHLAALANDGLVATAGMRRSGGRPEQLHVLTERGRELFPRRYPWFAELLIGLIRREHGSDGLRERLSRLGSEVAAMLRQRQPGATGHDTAVVALAGLMVELGYSASAPPGEDGQKVIEARNCVFHQLAMKDPDVCAFDLALLSGFTGSGVDHQECMARGGAVCRFRFRTTSQAGPAPATPPPSPS